MFKNDPGIVAPTYSGGRHLSFDISIFIFLMQNIVIKLITKERRSSESMWTERDLQTMLDPQLFYQGRLIELTGGVYSFETYIHIRIW